MRSPAAWILALTFALVSDLASAFESHEHRAFGRASLQVARWYLAQSTSGEEGERIAQAIARFDGEREAIHYGELAGCVDYFMNPEKILALRWKPRKDASGNRVEVAGDLPIDEFPFDSLPCRKEGLRWLQASHSNHAHFQQDLMMSLRVWHRLAIGIAKDEKNLFGALVVNAIADHFLQDFFAPGHLVTPRESLTDVPATAMHDLANIMGAAFTPKMSDRLATVLKFICTGSIKATDTARCLPGEPASSLLRELELTQIERPLARLLSGTDKPILFRGDGQLLPEKPNFALIQADQPGMIDDLKAQRLLLLAVETLGILDLFSGDNSMKSFGFSYDSNTGVPMASTDFGSYNFSLEGRRIDTLERVSADPSRAAAEKAAEEAGRSPLVGLGTRASVCSLGNCKDKLYALKTTAPLFSMGFHHESASHGALGIRRMYTLEYAGAGRLSDWSQITRGYVNTIQVTPVFGYTHYRESQSTGGGPSFRLPITVPETEFSVGPYLRWLRYKDEQSRVRKLGYGVMVEGGFSGYFTFLLSYGQDHGVEASGRLREASVWGAGVRFTVPLSRFPLRAAP
jgi:hypothetical protein